VFNEQCFKGYKKTFKQTHIQKLFFSQKQRMNAWPKLAHLGWSRDQPYKTYFCANYISNKFKHMDLKQAQFLHFVPDCTFKQ
jgi:hypothetical protein